MRFFPFPVYLSLNHSMVSLVHFSRLCNFVVYSVEDVSADDANFGFAWINESAGRVIYEIRFVVF